MICPTGDFETFFSIQSFLSLNLNNLDLVDQRIYSLVGTNVLQSFAVLKVTWRGTGLFGLEVAISRLGKPGQEPRQEPEAERLEELCLLICAQAHVFLHRPCLPAWG